MSTVVGSLIVKLSAHTAEFTTGLAKASGQLQAFFHKATSMGGLMAGVGAGAIFHQLVQSMEKMADVGHLAERLGLPAEELTRLGYAATMSGSSVEEFSKSLERMTRIVAQVAGGGDPAAAKAMEKLGLSAKDLVEMNAGEQFKEIAEGVKHLEDPSARALVAFELFGRGGQRMLNMLMEGKIGLQAWADEADRVGATKFDATIASMEQGERALKRLTASWESVKAKAAEFALVPGLEVVAADVDLLTGNFRSLEDAVSKAWKVISFIPRVVSGEMAAEVGAQQLAKRLGIELPDLTKYLPWNINKTWYGEEEGAKKSGAGKFFEDDAAALKKQAEIIEKIQDQMAKFGKSPGEQAMIDFLKTGPSPTAISQMQELVDEQEGLTDAAKLWAQIHREAAEQGERLQRIQKQMDQEEKTRQAEIDRDRGQAQAEAFEGMDRFADSQEKAAKSIREQFDPLFKYAEELKALQGLNLPADVYGKAAEAARKTAVESLMAQVPELKLPAGPEMGSAAAFQRVAEAQGGLGNPQIALLTEANSKLEEIRKNTEKNTQPPVAEIP